MCSSDLESIGCPWGKCYFCVHSQFEKVYLKRNIDDLMNEIRRRADAGERVLVTTLTKKMAEDLTDYLLESGIRARYLDLAGRFGVQF